MNVLYYNVHYMFFLGNYHDFNHIYNRFPLLFLNIIPISQHYIVLLPHTRTAEFSHGTVSLVELNGLACQLITFLLFTYLLWYSFKLVHCCTINALHFNKEERLHSVVPINTYSRIYLQALKSYSK